MALTDFPILINGESGTGKELFAQSVHQYSARSAHPFIALNCASLSNELLESELFGYEEGAFTGAKRGGKKGLFELAQNGTIFSTKLAKCLSFCKRSSFVFCRNRKSESSEAARRFRSMCGSSQQQTETFRT